MSRAVVTLCDSMNKYEDNEASENAPQVCGMWVVFVPCDAIWAVIEIFLSQTLDNIFIDEAFHLNRYITLSSNTGI